MNRFKRREHGGTDFDNGFWLDVDKLRKWDDWTVKAREYLDTLGSEAKLMDIINDYEPVVTNFHKWLWGRIQEEHATAIEETFDLERRMMRSSDNGTAIRTRSKPKKLHLHREAYWRRWLGLLWMSRVSQPR
jgi:hypothetical protein